MHIYENESEPQELTTESDPESLTPIGENVNESFQSDIEEPDYTEMYFWRGMEGIRE